MSAYGSDSDQGQMQHRETALDAFTRPLRDLRISVTDRCNFRCTYCMPKEVFGPNYAFLSKSQLLSFDEITRLATIFARLGVKKLRITGGEPLLRPNLEVLISSLSKIEGIEDIALTTNGALLTKERATALKRGGLERVTISLDALDDTVFQRLNDVNFPVQRVLRAIDAADEAGLNPVKINAVIKRGENEDAIIPLVRHFRGTGHIVRFIEYMDVGTTNGWRLADVVPANEILQIVGDEWPIEPVAPVHPGEVASRYRFVDGMGEIGIISSVTHPFCGNCSRARLSSDGQLYTCLFGTVGRDLRELLRNHASDIDIEQFLRGVWRLRDDRYSERRTEFTQRGNRIEMSSIGG